MSSFICCVIQLSILCTVMAEYSFVQQPMDTDAIEGMLLTLQCTVYITSIGREVYNIRWQLNGSSFTEETPSEYTVEENRMYSRYNLSLTSTLTLFDVSNQDGGSYRCKLFSESRPALLTSNNAKGVVIPKPKFRREPRNLSVIESGNATLECNTQAVDSNIMSVKWTREDLDFVTTEANTTSLDDRGQAGRYSVIGGNQGDQYHLQIVNVRKSDAGTFVCSIYLKTSGEVILKSRGVTLEVLYPPGENYPSCSTVESKKFSLGDTLTTECISRGGNGPLRLSWIRNGDEINGTIINDKHPYIKDDWTLRAVDNDAYITCIMKGTSVLTRRQCVIGPLNVHFGPIVSVEPETTQVSVGHPVTFKCSVNANPPITVTYTWFLDQQQLGHSNPDLTIDLDKIEEHVTPTKSEINVTCTVDGNTSLSDAAILKIPSLTTTPAVNITSQAMQKRLSSVILCIVVSLSLFLVIIVIIMCSIYVLRRSRETKNDIGYNWTVVQNDERVENEYMLEDIQNISVGNRDNDETLRQPIVAVNEENGNTNATSQELDVTDIDSVGTKKEKMEDRAEKGASLNSNIPFENMGVHQSGRESIDPDSMEDREERRQRNVEGLIYAELQHRDDDNGNGGEIIRTEHPVIYAELMNSKK